MQPGAMRGQPLGGLRGQEEEVVGGGGGEEGRSLAWVLPGLEGEKAVARWWAELKTGLPSSIGGRFQCRSRLRDHGDKGYLLMGSAAAIAAVKNPPPLRQTAIEVGCRGARSGRAMLLRSDAIEERCYYRGLEGEEERVGVRRTSHVRITLPRRGGSCALRAVPTLLRLSGEAGGQTGHVVAASAAR